MKKDQKKCFFVCKGVNSLLYYLILNTEFYNKEDSKNILFVYHSVTRAQSLNISA